MTRINRKKKKPPVEGDLDKPPPPKGTPEEPSGEPEEMKAIGESMMGEEPEIGQKDTGVGSQQPPPAP